MRTTDRVFGYALLTVLYRQKPWTNALGFSPSAERVWEKRRRRFALPAQSKTVLWSAV